MWWGTPHLIAALDSTKKKEREMCGGEKGGWGVQMERGKNSLEKGLEIV